ncbi:MAG TPA: M20/M25/M40 family metallo-hydrolase [Thermoanaerobaculia bacterium]|nr:M20/M25/M40 family metallo-hydrolase [Thermoanaerobaculia bacterium]
MSDPISLARQLIDIPSLTGEEGAVGECLVRLFRDHGFQVRRHEVEAGRFNLLVETETPAAAFFCSHIDTVPPFIPSSEDADFVYGRGACDAKGIIAAMIVAGERLLERGMRAFGYLLVVGEETDSIGAKRANIDLSGSAGTHIIVGEPTESRFVRASKGALTAVVRFRGIAAHSAYPDRGDSAIRKMASAIDRIYEAQWGSDALLGSGTPNVGVVRGGEKPNVIPAWAEAEMIFRIVESPESALERLRGIVEPLDGEIVRHHGNNPTYMFAPREEEAVVVGFNTDVPHLPAFGRPILYGPGSILDAHTAGEKISKIELTQSVSAYVSMVESIVKGSWSSDAQD